MPVTHPCWESRFHGGNESPSPALPPRFPSSNPCSKLFHSFKSRQSIGIFVSNKKKFYLIFVSKKNANPLRAQFIKQDHVCFCLGSCCPCRWPHRGPIDLCCFRTLNQTASEGLQVRTTFIRRGSVFICMLLLSGNQFLPRVTTECSHFLRSLSSKSVS